MSEDKLSDTEKRLFYELPRTKKPPKNLESTVLKRLREEALLDHRTKKNTYLKWSTAIAASIILFVCGIYFERLNTYEMTEIEPKKGYMLLLHEDAEFTPGDPMAMYNEYKNWMESTFEQGVKITGQELKDEAVIVDGTGQSLKKEEEKRTTGYFILEAETLEKAIKVAQKNPHIKYGGTIEVKPYMVR